MNLFTKVPKVNFTSANHRKNFHKNTMEPFSFEAAKLISQAQHVHSE
jgi:hypothetical protein